ncbi:LAME_0B04258g1_1 [Lachancea meyersii CBS 8951]|uniref:LAME_0B04258g1_1 n=1 Tax=Lachancea meyersii CBS 8951 TaxID=1266667 RepID=A0A1G4IUJ1_9SACH|nr:LAME_0B04258g1_1 [Lachancea meyersii CBS 8951]
MSRPIIIGNRGYRGKYPENSLVAFEKALEAGVDVIGTDLQMSRDGVVIISHDQSTLRCWNRQCKVGETDWSELKTLRCTSSGYTDLKMLTLIDVLKWVVDHPEVKLMLDIKYTNDQEIMLKSVAGMLSVQEHLPFWREHIIWGLWDVDWFQYGMDTGVIKDFEVVAITLSLEMAKRFVEFSRKIKNPHFRLSGVSVHFVSTWTSAFRNELIPYLSENNVHTYVWTVNKAQDFKQCAALPIAGFVTDFPTVARETISKQTPSQVKFKRPFPLTRKGLRFYAFILLYQLTVLVLFSSLAQHKIAGFSLSMLVARLLKAVHAV